MQQLISQLYECQDLNDKQVKVAAAFLLNAKASTAEKVNFLRALALKGESTTEITTFVQAFLKLAVRPQLKAAELPGPTLDVVGTGGDQLHLFNVSTTAMFILAGGGVCITKHGNRGVTSKAGGADVLEALGVKIDLPVERITAAIQELGVAFLYAPMYHPAFKAVAEARKILGQEKQRTLFNLLGPLLNPVQPEHQLIGVYDSALAPQFAQILATLGRKAAWVVHGQVLETGSGMDELSTLGVNMIHVLKDGQIQVQLLDAQQLGFPHASLTQLVGGDAFENAGILRAILSGEDRGPRRDIALLNAAAGFVICGLAPDIQAGLDRAATAIDSGAASRKLQALIDWR
jgi:anthranilate phosphoribosyltransferase